jgi:VWFA-related protein
MKRPAGTILSLVLYAAVVSAQSPASLPVCLSAAAFDVNGAPVSDLKLDDFHVTDQGRPQRIEFFHPGGGDAFDAAPVAPHESSNRAAGTRLHSAVILFDLLNENQTERLDVWHKLGRSLAQLKSGESIYFYLLTLEGNLTPIHPIGAKTEDDKTWPQGVEKVLDKAMKAASHARPMEMGDTEAVVKKTYVAFETIANQLALLPGRRDIIWITSGMPNVWNPKTPCNGDWVDCALYVPHLAVTLDRTRVAMNPLSYTSNPSPDSARDLEQIAGLTGGWTYFAEDIGSVLDQVARDAVSSYLICFDPPAGNWDSKFHKVRLTTERKGAKLHVRDRYYAYPETKPEALQQAALGAAYQSPVDDPGIGLHASTAAAAGGKSLSLQFRIDPADLLLREENGTLSGAVLYVIADIGASGPVGNPTISRYEIQVPGGQRDRTFKDGVPIAQDHPINDSIQKIRVIVLDQATNATGSLTISLAGGRPGQ